MDSVENKKEKNQLESRFNEEIQSKAVRAGRRTYFFDVKKTRGEELYLTITESKRKYAEDGSFSYEKHKIFLYQEDFDKFSDSLNEMFDYIAANQQEKPKDDSAKEEKDLIAKEEKDFSDVDFEDI